jgi:hypothetical protein
LPEIFDEDSLLDGYGKRKKDFEELLSSRYFISDEDLAVDFDMRLVTIGDLYNRIRVEMQTASEMSIPNTDWTC